LKETKNPKKKNKVETKVEKERETKQEDDDKEKSKGEGVMKKITKLIMMMFMKLSIQIIRKTQEMKETNFK
jgi:hypothetical protein